MLANFGMFSYEKSLEAQNSCWKGERGREPEPGAKSVPWSLWQTKSAGQTRLSHWAECALSDSQLPEFCASGLPATAGLIGLLGPHSFPLRLS